MRSTGKAPEAYYFHPPTKDKKLRMEVKRITSIAVSMLKKADKADLYLLGVCLNTLLKLTEIQYKKLDTIC